MSLIGRQTMNAPSGTIYHQIVRVRQTVLRFRLSCGVDMVQGPQLGVERHYTPIFLRPTSCKVNQKHLKNAQFQQAPSTSLHVSIHDSFSQVPTAIMKVAVFDILFAVGFVDAEWSDEDKEEAKQMIMKALDTKGETLHACDSDADCSRKTHPEHGDMSKCCMNTHVCGPPNMQSLPLVGTFIE
ncbi:hypothetical protein RvY_14736 [Ramazzottius varieornatus]|uniref:Uncharacterized protein n=1 Tax=Ramazzottius varieornatus TaxID=947166 RepID=A0A1D1VZK3_RAMVA|nr:hypothetical protein RvY_14736 [Ramazzottius varieornatus]